MASTNKTPQLGLNQWAAGDEVLRADFNADNLAIEAGMAAAQALGSCVVGNFRGDGKGNRHIDVGFRPRFAIITGTVGIRNCLGLIFTNTSVTSAGEPSNSSDILKMTDTGFSISDPDSFNQPCINGRTFITYYVVFR